MGAFLNRLDKSYDPAVSKFIFSEYFYLPQFACLLPTLKGNWKWLAIFQFCFFISFLMVIEYCLMKTAIQLKDFEFSLAAQAIHFAALTLWAIGVIINVNLNRGTFWKLWKCASEFDLEFFGPNFEKDKIQNWNNEVKIFKRKLLMGSAIYFLLLTFTILAGVPLMDNYQGIVINETYLAEVNMQLPVPIWLSFEITNRTLYIVGLGIEITQTILVILPLYCGILIIISLSRALILHFKILLLSIEKIEERALNSYKVKYGKPLQCKSQLSLYRDEDFIKEYKLCFKQSILHHYEVIRFFNYINKMQRWPMFYSVLLDSFVLAFALFVITKGEKRIGPQLVSLLLIFVEAGAVGVICWISQQITDMSEELGASFYKTNWIYCTKEIKTSIRIVQERTKIPLQLKAGGLSVLNWELYAAIMNSAYSYFNLIYAMT